MSNRWLFSLLLAGVASVAGAADPEVRVRIVYTLDQVEATPSGTWNVREIDGAKTWAIAADTDVKIAARPDGVAIVGAEGKDIAVSKGLTLETDAPENAFLLEGIPFGIGWWWESKEDRRYEGRLEARVTAEGKLDLVLIQPIEEYLRGVVPSEIGGDAPPEALKAQAVAARSETVVALRTGKYRGPHYDLCADVECQAFSGIGKRTSATDAAIQATRSLILSYKGDAIGAYYASNCGGHSENVENVWPDRSGAVPYWSGHADGPTTETLDLTSEPDFLRWLDSSPPVFCNPARNSKLPSWSGRNFRWERKFTADELSTMVARRKDIGRVTAIRPGKRGISGRFIESTFVGEKGEISVGPELAIRQMVEPPLRSAAFVVTTEGPAGRPDSFTIRGAGWGHGVGMCQTGAIARALSGQDFKAILVHYYHEADVTAAY